MIIIYQPPLMTLRHTLRHWLYLLMILMMIDDAISLFLRHCITPLLIISFSDYWHYLRFISSADIELSFRDYFFDIRHLFISFTFTFTYHLEVVERQDTADITPLLGWHLLRPRHWPLISASFRCHADYAMISPLYWCHAAWLLHTRWAPDGGGGYALMMPLMPWW